MIFTEPKSKRCWLYTIDILAEFNFCDWEPQGAHDNIKAYDQCEQNLDKNAQEFTKNPAEITLSKTGKFSSFALLGITNSTSMLLPVQPTHLLQSAK